MQACCRSGHSAAQQGVQLQLQRTGTWGCLQGVATARLSETTLPHESCQLCEH